MHFRKLGYRTLRSYASKGIYDLLCFRESPVEESLFGMTFTEVLEVQVKGTPWEFSEQDKAALKAHAEEIGARAVYAYGKYGLRIIGKGKKGQPIYRRKKNRTLHIEYL